MTMTDPIADMLTRVRNASSARHESVDVPAFKMAEQVAGLLKQEGYIRDVRRLGTGIRGKLRVFLRYEPDGTPVIHELQRVSKPGRRVYRTSAELPQVLDGLGVAIISTSQGLMTDRESRKRNLGGEVICSVA